MLYHVILAYQNAILLYRNAILLYISCYHIMGALLRNIHNGFLPPSML